MKNVSNISSGYGELYPLPCRRLGPETERQGSFLEPNLSGASLRSLKYLPEPARPWTLVGVRNAPQPNLCTTYST